MPLSENPKIMLGLATRGDDIVPSLFEFILRNTMVHGVRFVWKGCGWSAVIPQEAVYQEAIKLEADYLLIVDSDVTPPIDALDKLLECEKDIVTAPIWHYDVRLGDIHLNVTKEFGIREIDSNKIGLETMRSSSFGCLLMSKKVLDKFKENKETFVTWSPLIEESLKTMSSDVIMFRKIERFGFQLYVNWDVRGCEHYTKIHLSDRVLSQFRQGKQTILENTKSQIR